MALYGSQEWLDEYQSRINGSPAYRKAAAGWEGELAFVFEAEPDHGWPKTRCAILDLWHGECRDARVVEEADAKAAQFCIRGPYTRWKQVLTKDLDPVMGIMQGKLRLRGDLTLLMRYMAASKQLVALASEVPTEFPDEQ